MVASEWAESHLADALSISVVATSAAESLDVTSHSKQTQLVAFHAKLKKRSCSLAKAPCP